ncbi:nitrous oxide reductase accessory protein NosL [Mucilaginibacter mali]|jgi:copper chaperone NosL|uniref:Nitrous oxide reductase accessory protein NosL n=1 Tax=Mucilaginibacter mali TaxID=2740462 RepID=A0A7D4QIV1_9SPHI|nr:nitrous oxide reductase accessory protein NosL [Mucilaginibacter mali]QKJ32972.1 nitrous oxide reductase accessory protein NosL [Mucilaginibacter mali]
MKKLLNLCRAAMMVLLLPGCKPGFEPVNYGHDNCTHCRMTIVDKRFTAELLTSKGRAYKFDDFGCLLNYLKEEHVNDPGMKIYVADFDHPGGQFLDARQAVFIRNEKLHSPMNGNLAAYMNKTAAANAGTETKLLTLSNLE